MKIIFVYLFVSLRLVQLKQFNLMFNFDEKICNQRLVIEELLKNFILFDNWYFVLSFNIEKARGFRFLFDSLIKFKLQKKHDD